MKPFRVVFRVDSSEEIGTGHLLECLRLAKTTNMCAIFCVRDNKKSLNLIKQFNFPVKVIKIRNNKLVNEYEILNGLLKKIKPDVLIVDLLHFNKKDKEKLNLEGVKLVIFNAIFYPVKGDYNFSTVFLPLLKNKQYSGTNYILLRPSFIDKKPQIIKKDVNEILVMFGGSDPKNLTLKTLNAISLIKKNIKVNIVIGGLNKNKKVIERFTSSFKKPYKIYINIKNDKILLKLMRGVDLAIISGGYTLCELMHFGTPTIAMSQNIIEEKKIYPLFPSNSFEDIGRGQKISIKKISKTIIDLMDNYPVRKEMNMKAPKIVDGRGIFRVYDILKNTK